MKIASVNREFSHRKKWRRGMLYGGTSYAEVAEKNLCKAFLARSPRITVAIR